MSDELDRINPPVLYATGWWFVLAGCVMTAAVVGLLVRRALGGRDWGEGIDVEPLRDATLARIGELLEAAADGDDDVRRDAVTRVGAEVRRFLGTVTGTDLDYTTRAQWVVAADRDPRLAPAVDLLVELGYAVFRPEGDVDVAALGMRAVEVVTTWR
ncbi:hypothetical protein [Nocardioides marmotae]|uniref:DUF4129 domain-containing protein n=1 Tax=Nocardioides marmotae TaxID=2663857 RepID=A0A6I3J597_9ACTN|nr:hypothetical protein [Nocardioides marmotae]MCR6030710.1 hypothetical protein [Gordonia jinghuaiqii]MBC9734022.1 hypothetical protein [Nocardioides marmotae]MTB85125.1 hypothetical protein [Nocardioides marmotae]MTB94344.1 hypothetical protein [Nocardioides marmotae]QKE01628.1 hypothetical protein HPC71_11455 [Nocardioides marmotae]